MTREEMVETPRSLGCAGCGKPLDCLNSFGVSVPVESSTRPADFCGLSCLATWAAKQSSEGRA